MEGPSIIIIRIIIFGAMSVFAVDTVLHSTLVHTVAGSIFHNISQIKECLSKIIRYILKI